MCPGKTFISVSVTEKEIKMIEFIRNNSDANTKAAAVRKGFYALYESLINKDTGDIISLPTEAI